MVRKIFIIKCTSKGLLTPIFMKVSPSLSFTSTFVILVFIHLIFCASTVRGFSVGKNRESNVWFKRSSSRISGSTSTVPIQTGQDTARPQKGRLIKDESFERWSNPKYDTTVLNNQFISIGKSLLTIGSKGVAPSQINSLLELLKQHERVIVKLASDRIDPIVVSQEFTKSENTKSVELLQVRKRSLMFGTKKS